jgi:hypothetical protein
MRRTSDDEDDCDNEARLKEIDEPLDEEDQEAAEEEDGDRAASDAAVLAALDQELVDENDDLVLTQDDINLGRFAIHKVTLAASV